MVEEVVHAVPSATASDATCSRSSTSSSCAGCSSGVYDEREFLSPYGIRSLSKVHEAQPFEFDGRVVALRAGRGGVEAQGRQLELARADLVPDDVPAHRDRCASSAPRSATRYTRTHAGAAAASRSRFRDMARDLARRMIDIFLRDEQRPAAGVRRRARSSRTIRTGAITCCSTSTSTATTAPASARRHQTGWTALVANLIDEWR